MENPRFRIGEFDRLVCVQPRKSEIRIKQIFSPTEFSALNFCPTLCATGNHKMLLRRIFCSSVRPMPLPASFFRIPEKDSTQNAAEIALCALQLYSLSKLDSLARMVLRGLCLASLAKQKPCIFYILVIGRTDFERRLESRAGLPTYAAP